MKLVINADDYGLTDGLCESVITLFEENAISDTTILVCVDGIEARCERLKKAGLADRAGLHLQTTLERHHRKPLSDPKDIPSLVDADGGFRHHDFAYEFAPADIALEWERQIHRFEKLFGQLPTHMDSHHGTHRLEQLTSVYLKLAAKYGIPVRGGREPGQIDGSALDVKSSTMCEAGWTGQNKDVESLKRAILKNLPKVGDGVLEIVAHPAFLDDDLIQSSSWNAVRENDHKVLLELAQSGWLQAQGIKLVHYPELA